MGSSSSRVKVGWVYRRNGLGRVGMGYSSNAPLASLQALVGRETKSCPTAAGVVDAVVVRAPTTVAEFA